MLSLLTRMGWRFMQDVPSALRGPGQRKSVRWADEAPEDGGFAIGGAALRQLETVYVLEGLGPPKDLGTPAPRSFADQACDHLCRTHSVTLCMLRSSVLPQTTCCDASSGLDERCSCSLQS